MTSIAANDPVAVAVVETIRGGDVEALREQLLVRPELSGVRIRDRKGCGRTLLHVATDWPGHFPRVAETVSVLVEAGADVDAPFEGSHAETALHWAASSDDVEALDALLDAGADLEAPGSVIGGGTALADAVAFGQWQAARRLVECGAHAELWQAAALGLVDRLQEELAAGVTPQQVTGAFWQACHGGQLETAELLLSRGAELDWVGWDGRTALDIATEQGATAVVEWLRSRGGRSAAELLAADPAP